MEKEEIREIERKCIEDEKSLIFDSFSQVSGCMKYLPDLQWSHLYRYYS